MVEKKGRRDEKASKKLPEKAEILAQRAVRKNGVEIVLQESVYKYPKNEGNNLKDGILYDL